MSEVRDWLWILTLVALGLVALWLWDSWFNHGQFAGIVVRELRENF